MVKIIIGVVLMCVAGGGWLYLDCLTNHEQAIAEQMHQSVDQARTEAKRRAEARAGFEYQINADLTACQATADKAHNDYGTLYAALIQKAPPVRKNVPFTIPQAVSDEAASILASAKAACQQTHDTRLQNGH